ncbi:PKD repeat-containing protein, partial [Methanophagales archaeon]
MRKAVTFFGLILLLIAIVPLFVCTVSAEPIIIDTEKGVLGFRTEPARDLPANWQYVHDHPDTSADGWFDTNAYPPGQGNGSFWYAISFPDLGECKGIWETSVPYTGKYEVFAWIPCPDSFDPYLDEATPPSDYLPTKRAQYKVFHNGGVATVTIDQNEGGFTSLGVFEFDSTARVELSSNGVEFWRCVAFDAVKVKSNRSPDKVSPSKINLSSRTINVPDDYPTVHDAVNVANEGDTIIAYNEFETVYYDYEIINGDLTLQTKNIAFKVTEDGCMMNNRFRINGSQTQIEIPTGISTISTSFNATDVGKYICASENFTVTYPEDMNYILKNHRVIEMPGGYDPEFGGGLQVTNYPYSPSTSLVTGMWSPYPLDPVCIYDYASNSSRLLKVNVSLGGGFSYPGKITAVSKDDDVYLFTAEEFSGQGSSIGGSGNLSWPISAIIDYPNLASISLLNITLPRSGWMERTWTVDGYDLYAYATSTDKYLYYINLTNPEFLDSSKNHEIIPSKVLPSNAPFDWGYLYKLNNDILFQVHWASDNNNYVFYNLTDDTWKVFTAKGWNVVWHKREGNYFYLLLKQYEGSYHYRYIFNRIDLTKLNNLEELTTNPVETLWEKTYHNGYANYHPTHIVNGNKICIIAGTFGYLDSIHTYNLLTGELLSEENLNINFPYPHSSLRNIQYPFLDVSTVYGSFIFDIDRKTIYPINLSTLVDYITEETGVSLGEYGYYSFFLVDYDASKSNLLGTMYDYINKSSYLTSVDLEFEAIENIPPNANASGPYYGNVSEDIQFYGNGTPAVGRTIVAYEWSFDGETATEQNTTHTYSEAGTYVATLRVQDSADLWSPPNECTVQVFEPFTFVQVTDVHVGCKYVDVNPLCKNPTERSIGWFTSVINGINKLAPEVDFVLVTGDLVQSDEPDFFYKFMDVLTRLDSSIRFYHIPGNHDRYTHYGFGDDLTNYHDCVLKNGPRQILIEPDNYTFEYGGYTFIGLDSGADWPLAHLYFWGTGLTEPQINGLRTHRFTNPDAPKIIFMHHPVFNDYSFILGVPYFYWGIIANNRKPFITYCQDNKVQLVLTGHTHEDKIFNANGKRVGWNSNDRPLFIQTGSVTEHSEYRVIEVNSYDDIFIHPSTDQPICWKKSIWSDGSDKSVLHVYDSQGRHTGIDGSGNVVNEIPHSYYIGNYGPMNLEGIILYDDTEDYKLTVTLKDGSIQPLDGKLQQPENQSFNITITNQTGDSLTTISYNNMTFTENTTATVNLNRTGANYTMAIDYSGDNITDEAKDPDSIETDYAPSATINTPVNNSIYRYGDQIVFNGTGIDIEDGSLTNSSLFWTSTLDGFIGIDCECNTTNLTAGTHIIELTVNDSSGQTDTDNVTLTVIAPDLAVTNIAFSNPQPIEGEAVTINATIGNLGTANAADVIVQFFDGTPTDDTQIGTNQTIATLNAGENKTVSVVWATTGEAGDNCIWVVADPADTIKEPDEENNQANCNIFVGAPNVLHIVQAQTDRAEYL